MYKGVLRHLKKAHPSVSSKLFHDPFFHFKQLSDCFNLSFLFFNFLLKNTKIGEQGELFPRRDAHFHYGVHNPDPEPGIFSQHLCDFFQELNFFDSHAEPSLPETKLDIVCGIKGFEDNT